MRTLLWDQLSFLFFLLSPVVELRTKDNCHNDVQDFGWFVVKPLLSYTEDF